MTFNYLLDENVSPALRAALHQRQPEMTVWIIGDPDTPQRGTLDPDLLLWCEKRQFSLVTNNRASMPAHLQEHLNAGRHVPAIFILNPRLTLGQTAEDLFIIWSIVGPDEYRDQIKYLPLSV